MRVVVGRGRGSHRVGSGIGQAEEAAADVGFAEVEVGVGEDGVHEGEGFGFALPALGDPVGVGADVLDAGHVPEHPGQGIDPWLGALPHLCGGDVAEDEVSVGEVGRTEVDRVGAGVLGEEEIADVRGIPLDGRRMAVRPAGSGPPRVNRR